MKILNYKFKIVDFYNIYIYICDPSQVYVGTYVRTFVQIPSHVKLLGFDRERSGRMELYSDMWEGAGGGRQTLREFAHSNRFQFDRVGNTFFSSPPPQPSTLMSIRYMKLLGVEFTRIITLIEIL